MHLVAMVIVQVLQQDALESLEGNVAIDLQH
jgi:hypothetical protein